MYTSHVSSLVTSTIYIYSFCPELALPHPSFSAPRHNDVLLLWTERRMTQQGWAMRITADIPRNHLYLISIWFILLSSSSLLTPPPPYSSHSVSLGSTFDSHHRPKFLSSHIPHRLTSHVLCTHHSLKVHNGRHVPLCVLGNSTSQSHCHTHYAFHIPKMYTRVLTDHFVPNSHPTCYRHHLLLSVTRSLKTIPRRPYAIMSHCHSVNTS